MNRGKAWVLLAFTLWPLIWIVLFIVLSVTLFVGAGRAAGPAQPEPPDWLVGGFLLIFLVHFATILEVFVLIAIYVVHLFKNDRVPEDQKPLWGIIIFLGNIVAMPVYWYLYIRRSAESEQRAL